MNPQRDDALFQNGLIGSEITSRVNCCLQWIRTVISVIVLDAVIDVIVTAGPLKQLEIGDEN